jgi:hypothetical protein
MTTLDSPVEPVLLTPPSLRSGNATLNIVTLTIKGAAR